MDFKGHEWVVRRLWPIVQGVARTTLASAATPCQYNLRLCIFCVISIVYLCFSMPQIVSMDYSNVQVDFVTQCMYDTKRMMYMCVWYYLAHVYVYIYMLYIHIYTHIIIVYIYIYTHCKHMIFSCWFYFELVGSMLVPCSYCRFYSASRFLSMVPSVGCMRTWNNYVSQNSTLLLQKDVCSPCADFATYKPTWFQICHYGLIHCYTVSLTATSSLFKHFAQSAGPAR